MPKRERKLVANNKKARHDYFIEEVYEAGIVLTGTEIKSVRQGKVSIKESYAKIENMEMILYGLNIRATVSTRIRSVRRSCCFTSRKSASCWDILPRKV